MSKCNRTMSTHLFMSSLELLLLFITTSNDVVISRFLQLQSSSFLSCRPSLCIPYSIKMDTWYKDLYLTTLPKVSDRVAANLARPELNMWSGDHPMGGANTYAEMVTRYPLSAPFDTLEVLQNIIQPVIGAPKSTLNRFAGPWTSKRQSVSLQSSLELLL